MTTDEIRRWSAADLGSRPRLAELLDRIARLDDEDERDELFYALATRLSEEWLLDRAQAVAESMSPGMAEKATALTGVGVRWARVGDATKAREAFALAAAAARACEMLWLRAEALLAIGRAAWRASFQDLATEVMSEATEWGRQGELVGPQDGLDAAGVLGEIAEEWMLMGARERAQAVADQIRFPVRRERALARLRAITAREHP